MNGSGDIAIVGMAGLYPKADDIDVFWSNILNGVDAVTEADERWSGDPALYDPETTDIRKIYTRRGGFLGDLSRFDARSFGTMPRSVTGAHPDQFLALKLARDALVDAGQMPGKFDGRSTGVILGHAIHANRANTNGVQTIWFNAQIRELLRTLVPDMPGQQIDAAIAAMQAKQPEIAVEAVPGLVPNILTGRIANRLDLMGPNYIIDAACASSLIAVDLAIGELRAGRADMMLAGGINTTTSPLVYALFCSISALSRTGEIRPFDRGANGTILGEGGGILVLKRLENALRDDDRIHAVIKGVGQSSDGKSSGLMAPRLEGEVLAMERAYRQTGIDPATIGLVEAHGTGIPLGDRIEVEAMRRIFGGRKGRVPTVPLGSIKSMIGHCIPASGSASIIKLAHALAHKTVPPTLCREVSADLGLEDTPFYLATEAEPWLHTASMPRRAAINAFGFGGINAHMILEESPVGRSTDATAAFMPRGAAPAEAERVFVFAGADRATLAARVHDTDLLLANDPSLDLDALARGLWGDAAAAGRGERLAVVAGNARDLTKKLATVAGRLADPAVTSLRTRNGIYYESAPEPGRIAFLFPGEMAQYPGMMRDAAIALPQVRAWFEFICALFAGEREIGHRELLLPPPNLVDADAAAELERALHQVDYGSELVFAADQAAFAVLGALGIRPDAMLGHSTGENAALVASGLLGLTPADVGRLIKGMNEIFSAIDKSGTVPTGTLLTVAALDRERLLGLIEARPDVHFTMDNCPNQAVLFGQASEIEALRAEAVALGAVCTTLPISWGYHTGFVRTMAEAFGRLFADVDFAESDVTLYSCVTARPFPRDLAGFRQTAELQYASRVRFTEAVEQLYADGCRIFVECGPNSNLTAFVRDILGDRPYFAESVDSRRRGMLAQLRHLIAGLFTAGVDLNPEWLLFPEEGVDALRRRAERAAQRAAPALPNELVFIRFDDAEAESLRAQQAGPSAVASATAAAATTADTDRGSPAGPAAIPTPAARQAGGPPANARPANGKGPNGATQAMHTHVDLMRTFLASGEPVARSALARMPRGRAQAGRPVDARAHAPATGSRRITMLDLGPAFATPFAFSGYLMRGTPAPAGLMPYLAEPEHHEAERVAARFGQGARWAEWGLSRLAVKRAAADLIAAEGESGRPGSARIAVMKDENGAPFVALDDPARRMPAISIAHAAGRGAGAACDPRWRLGLDFDSPARVRDAAEFLDTILSPAEQSRLRIPRTATAAAALWCIKEASAKALGLGIAGDPRAFAIMAYEPARGEALVRHGDFELAAIVRALGGGMCAIAYAPADAGAWAAEPAPGRGIERSLQQTEGSTREY